MAGLTVTLAYGPRIPSATIGCDTMAKRRRADQKKGIFCLEGIWYGDKDKTSVEPVLRFLETMDDLEVLYQHRGVATRGEFDFHLQRWKQSSFKTHPILYLVFHGNPGEIEIEKRQDALRLDQLGEMLEGACKGRIIHFGSCSTLDVHGNKLNSFLSQSGALAICGYKTDVDWLPATAFDLLLLGYLQEISFTRHGISKLDRLLTDTAPGLQKELGF